MRFLFVLLAILCGIVVLIKMSTGDLSSEQVLAIAVILLGVAVVAPRTWPTGWVN